MQVIIDAVFLCPFCEQRMMKVQIEGHPNKVGVKCTTADCRAFNMLHSVTNERREAWPVTS